MIKLMLAYLFIGAFFWRISPLGLEGVGWKDWIRQLLAVYFWMFVLIAGLWFLFTFQ